MTDTPCIACYESEHIVNHNCPTFKLFVKLNNLFHCKIKDNLYHYNIYPKGGIIKCYDGTILIGDAFFRSNVRFGTGKKYYQWSPLLGYSHYYGGPKGQHTVGDDLSNDFNGIFKNFLFLDTKFKYIDKLTTHGINIHD